jgi:hypothetical protein
MAGALFAFSRIPILAIGLVYVGDRGPLGDYFTGDPNEMLMGLVFGILLGVLWAVESYISALRSP